MLRFRLPQLLLGLAAVLVIATAMIYTTQRLASQAPSVRNRPATGNSNAVACTADAKECPDGSFVGRVSPSCEFAACPAVPTTNENTNASNTNSAINSNTNTSVASPTPDTQDWKTYANADYGIEFRYPTDWQVTAGAGTNPYKITAVSKDGQAGSVEFWVTSVYSDQRENTDNVTESVMIAGKPAAKTTVQDKTTKQTFYYSLSFPSQPPGWGTNAEIRVYPDAAGSFANPDTVLGSLTFTDVYADWEKIQNEEYGYSLSVPPSYRFDANRGVWLTDKKKPALAVSVNAPRPDGKWSWGFQTASEPLEQVTLVLANQTWKIFRYSSCQFDPCAMVQTYVTTVNGKSYGIALAGEFDVNTLPNPQQKILQSFALTDAVTAVPGWQLYEDAQHFFRVSFPEAWVGQGEYAGTPYAIPVKTRFGGLITVGVSTGDSVQPAVVITAQPVGNRKSGSLLAQWKSDNRVTSTSRVRLNGVVFEKAVIPAGSYASGATYLLERKDIFYTIHVYEPKQAKADEVLQTWTFLN